MFLREFCFRQTDFLWHRCDQGCLWCSSILQFISDELAGFSTVEPIHPDLIPWKLIFVCIYLNSCSGDPLMVTAGPHLPLEHVFSDLPNFQPFRKCHWAPKTCITTQRHPGPAGKQPLALVPTCNQSDSGDAAMVLEMTRTCFKEVCSPTSPKPGWANKGKSRQLQQSRWSGWHLPQNRGRMVRIWCPSHFCLSPWFVVTCLSSPRTLTFTSEVATRAPDPFLGLHLAFPHQEGSAFALSHGLQDGVPGTPRQHKHSAATRNSVLSI